MEYYLLLVHSWLRWVVLLSGAWAIGCAILGLIGNKPYSKLSNTASVVFVASVHTQVLLGLILYFVSPTVQAYLAGGFGAAMKDKVARYFVVEHAMGMILAAVIVQIGRTRSKKAATDALKYRRMLMFYTLAIILMVGVIIMGGRGWFRMPE